MMLIFKVYLFGVFPSTCTHCACNAKVFSKVRYGFCQSGGVQYENTESHKKRESNGWFSLIECPCHRHFQPLV